MARSRLSIDWLQRRTAGAAVPPAGGQGAASPINSPHRGAHSHPHQHGDAPHFPVTMMSEPLDRKVLDSLWPLIQALGLFGLIVGITKLLAEWDPDESVPHKIATLFGAIVASVLVGLPLNEYGFFHDRPGMLLSCSGIACWGGVEVIRKLFRRFGDRIIETREP